MELGITLLMIVAIGLGIVIGMYIEKTKIKKVETQGIIYVYCGVEDQQPSLLLEATTSMNDIATRKRVLFDVTVIR